MVDQKLRARRLTRVGGPVAAGLAVLLALSACGGSIGGGSDGGDGGSGDPGPLKIGMLAPITGPAAPEGIALQRGFDLAIEHINDDGGVFGQPVEVVFIDDQADPATATQAAQRLVQQEEVDYIFGTITDDTTIAAATVADQAGVPMSQAIATALDYCSPHFWPFGETPTQLLTDLVPRMVEEFGGNVALVGNDYVFPRTYHEVSTQLIEEAGGTVVAEEYSPLGTSDWQPIITRLQGAEPDWILSAVVGGDAVSFVQQADQFGLLEGRGLTGVSVDQQFYPALAPQLEGRSQVVRYTDQLDSELNATFVEAYREAYDTQEPIPGVAGNAYDGMRFIAEAFEQAGSTDAEAVSEQIAEMEFEGLGGPVGFDPDNHVVQAPMYLTSIEAGSPYAVVEELGVVTDEQEKDCA
ncbi:ABC transporter substrate-binding protein [Blastococcus saxobsidens]|uniref:ABC transporter substrate-binding protein n=1 Tax=Blastococcus saxobsidens TaxID=138336 RepID=A0A6L9W3S0_9ACTN|nr:substrate-binding protein [Blastococcus saxobsidens]NEK86131.1 ABC transporter substrate-binding protein [Blastococcus saxobsidens]